MKHRPSLTRLAAALAAALVVSGCGQDATSADSSAQAQEEAVPTLFWLDVAENAVYRATGPDFDDAERIVADTDIAPDGVAVDVANGDVYWTSMGLAWGDSYDVGHIGGTVQQAALDGTGVRRITSAGSRRCPSSCRWTPRAGTCTGPTARARRSGGPSSMARSPRRW